MQLLRIYLLPVIAMTAIVLASNVAVQFPVFAQIGSLQLADILTYGAFTYAFAFLVTDLTNRRYGPAIARRVVYIGFAAAVACSIVVPPVLYDLGFLDYATAAERLLRIAIASGGAFLAAQLLDIAVFNRLRQESWWRAPAASSLSGSVVDTITFFTVAFAPFFLFLGPNDGFALESAPLLGLMAVEAPRWVSWAIGDFTVKLFIAVFALVPYRIIMQHFMPARPVAAAGI
ncbi:queuosine precursor transporter [Aurantimonas coralicida]|uniref:queuosine precursor transporter n=1 Tax=Aurantimonas coralicida TaxID=182270 RepID=UPI002389C66E|nr:queuosine precursor transporter [Aurantimonas coralicida]MDE0923073.1 queuosine precursor transporter [Aurantimonas coralicida]